MPLVNAEWIQGDSYKVFCTECRADCGTWSTEHVVMFILLSPVPAYCQTCASQKCVEPFNIILFLLYDRDGQGEVVL